jgi:cytochrome c-type biogenesis protein CcmF
LYAWKASGIRSDAQFEWTSREAMVLINNLLLVVATASVLLGTLYPLLYEVMTDGKKISVGPPYFNRVFVPIVCLFLSRWRSVLSRVGAGHRVTC